MKSKIWRWAKLMAIGAFGALLLSMSAGPAAALPPRNCSTCDPGDGGGGGPPPSPPPPPPPPSCNYDQQTGTSVLAFGWGPSLFIYRATEKTNLAGWCSDVCPTASFHHQWEPPLGTSCDCYQDTIPQLRAEGVGNWEIHRTRYAIWAEPSVANTRTLLVALAGQNGSSGGSSGGGSGNTTGQLNHWQNGCDDNEQNCGTQPFSDMSFVGRLLDAPSYMNINRYNTFAVAFLDHQYEWNSPYRAAIRYGLFEWLKTKVDPAVLKQIIITGHSRGGYGLWDAGVSIKVDGAGNAYLTGITGTDTDIFTGAHFPILNAFQPQRASSYYNDAFVTKVSPQGAPIYSSYLGGTYEDEGHGIAIDAAGNVYLTGATMSADFPITPGAYQQQIAGGGCSYPFSCPDAFITKISNGNTMALTVTKAGTGSGTITSTRSGINCGADCSENYNIGTVVTLTATAAAGSTFAGWSDDVDCVDGIVTVNATKTCTARFDPATASADLLVSALSGPGVSAAGATITVTETTKNQGSGAASASTIKFYLSTNATFGTGDVLLGSRAVSSLAAGASHSTLTSLAIPSGTGSGNYFLLAVSDATQVVSEAKEGNNVKSKAFTIP